MRKTFIFISLFMLLSLPIMAQEIEMADQFRSDGKIYVVVMIMAIIVIGLFGYLYHLDKKVAKKEKELNS